MLSPGPPSRMSSTGFDQDIVPGTAGEHIVASAADQDIITVAPSPSVDRAGRQAEASTTSSPAKALIVNRSFAASAPVIFTRAARPSTDVPLASPTARATSSPLVPRTMTLSGWASPTPTAARVEVDLGDVGARQVVDDDRVGPAQRVEVDALHVVQVHGHAGDVRAARGPCSRRMSMFSATLAPLNSMVSAGLPLEDVVVVAGIPHKRVVTGAHQGHVVAVAAVDQIVTLTAEEHIGPEARRSS